MATPTRTHIIIDGLQDPVLARDLSARWFAAGFRNAVDIAGQCGWLERDVSTSAQDGDEAESVVNVTEKANDSAICDRPLNEADVRGVPEALNESDVAIAGGIARAFGVEIRDRAGTSFVAANDPNAVREQMVYEYRTRFAQSLVFGLPAIVLHYLGPILAAGGGESAGNMLYPWLIQAVLVGWALWVGGLPILWQGVMSALHLRTTADLLTTVIVTVAYVPSLIGMITVIFGGEPWFAADMGPTFHVAMLAIMLALFQRWQMYKRTDKLSGRASLMMPRFNRLCAAWIIALFVILLFADWRTALGFGLVFPAMISVGAINKWSPGWSMALPVLAFAPLYLFGERFTQTSIDNIRIEVATGFQLLMALVFAASWSRWPRRDDSQ